MKAINDFLYSEVRLQVDKWLSSNNYYNDSRSVVRLAIMEWEANKIGFTLFESKVDEK